MADKNLKTFGIVCDEYKVEKFEKDLKAAGFTDYEVVNFQNNCKVIRVKAPAHKLKDVAKVCSMVELHFKHGN